MNGKTKCKILKEIRARIAQENDIPYVTSQCKHQGACRGTCPKCEQELRELEQQLAKRRSLGKAVTVSALALSLTAGAIGCVPPQDGERSGTEASEQQETATLAGDVAVDPASGEASEDDAVKGFLVESSTETGSGLVVGELETEASDEPVMGAMPVEEAPTASYILPGNLADGDG